MMPLRKMRIPMLQCVRTPVLLKMLQMLRKLYMKILTENAGLDDTTANDWILYIML